MSSLGSGVTGSPVTVYWRPGCPLCARLRFGLRRARINTREVNIWDDPEAAATVRSVTGGDETVPTVVVGTVSLVNPSTRQVVAVCNGQRPPAPRTARARAARWIAVGAVIAASFAVDAIGYHGASWALDGLAIVVYLGFARWQR